MYKQKRDKGVPMNQNQPLTKQEIEQLPHTGEVGVSTFMAGNPPQVVTGLVAVVKNSHGSTDYYVPRGDKYVWSHRN